MAVALPIAETDRDRHTESDVDKMANSKLMTNIAEPPVEPIALETLAGRVFDALSAEVLSGRLRPGQRVDLGHYATIWNVSLTPLRDAAKQLEVLGFLKVMPRRGIFVSELTAKEVKDIFYLRIAFESMAVRLATPRIPPAEVERVRQLYIEAGEAAKLDEHDESLSKVDLLIHKLALDYCGNARLRKMMEDMWDLVEWCQNTIALRLNEPFLTTLPEHLAICDAILSGDPEAASDAMFDHLALTSERIQTILQKENPSGALGG
jgi:DNA-binding GntR family transcriptional regulator